MSDRYETPSWDDEPDELGAREPPRGDARPTRPADDEPDLDASSENVLDGWPVADVAADGDAADEAEPSEAADEADRRRAGRTAEPPAQERRIRRSSQRCAAAARGSRLRPMEHAPGELTVPPGYSVLEGEADGRAPRGRRRRRAVQRRRDDARCSSRPSPSSTRAGSRATAVTVMPVPGAFELPLAAMALAKTRRFACIVALGCVIRGDTPHFDYVSSEAASGLQLAAIETGVPVAFGVLTLDRADQAESRVERARRRCARASRWPTCSRTSAPRSR